MMTLERLLSFYRHSNPSKYAACISRPIVTGRVSTRLECEPRVLREQRLFKLHQTRGDTPRMRVSCLTESRLSSKKKSASPPWNLRYFNKVRAVSPLQRLHLFSILCLAFWQNKRATLLWNKPASSNVQSPVSTSNERCVFTLKETCTLAKQQSRVSSTMKSPGLHLEVCVTSTKLELRLHFNVHVSPMNESRVSTSDKVRVSKATWPLHLQNLCAVFTSAISSTVHWRK